MTRSTTSRTRPEYAAELASVSSAGSGLRPLNRPDAPRGPASRRRVRADLPDAATPRPRWREPWASRSRWASSAVALPLLALAEGYSAVQIGVLTAISAAAQLVMRLGHRHADAPLPGLGAHPSGRPAARLEHGHRGALGRAWSPSCSASWRRERPAAAWWTGSQTHGVRGSGPAVRPWPRSTCPRASACSSAPWSPACSPSARCWPPCCWPQGPPLLTCVPAVFLDRLPPFARVPDRPPGRLWTRPGVDAGCLGGGERRRVAGSARLVRAGGAGCRRPVGVRDRRSGERGERRQPGRRGGRGTTARPGHPA